MRSGLMTVLLLALTLLCSCSSIQVSQDFDESYDFLGKTYNWKSDFQPAEGNLLDRDELLAARFHKAIDGDLQARGYKLSSSPDMLVACEYTVSTQLVSDPVSPSVGFGFGRYSRFGAFGISSGQSIHQYDQGLFVVYIYDAATERLLWKGVGTQEVFTHSDPAKLDSSISELVGAVLKQFPPQ